MSVADDGGSTGRLRRDFGVLGAGRSAQVPGRARGRRRRRTVWARGVRAPVRGRRPRGSRARQPGDRRPRRGHSATSAGALDDAGRTARRRRPGPARHHRSRSCSRPTSRASAVRGPGRGPELGRPDPAGRARPARRAVAARGGPGHRAGRPDRAGPGLAVHEPAAGALRAAERPRRARRRPGRRSSQVVQPAAPGPRDHGSRRRRPPAGGAGAPGGGSTGSCATRASSLAARSRPRSGGPGGRAASVPRSPDPTWLAHRSGQTGVGALGSALVLSRLDEPMFRMVRFRAAAPAGTGQRRPGTEGS